MVREYPRPSYPGDFVSCNYYSHHASGFVFTITPDEALLSLTLPHDGLTQNQLYEVVFGPFLYSLTGDGYFVMFIKYGTTGFIYNEIFQSLDDTIVPVVKAYFAPQLEYPSEASVPYEDFLVEFLYVGEGSAEIQFGKPDSPSILAVRPADETNTDTFRVITNDYAL